MEDPLIGKFVQATSDISLVNKFVDGVLCRLDDFYIPKIKSGWKFRVKDSRDGIVVLQNLSSNDWVVCEVTEDEIGDFKLISKDSI